MNVSILPKKLAGAAAVGALILSSITPSFAADVYSSLKDNSFIKMQNGDTKISKELITEFTNEKLGSITSTQVIVETPEISGEGNAAITGKKSTYYKDSDADAIVDVKVGIYVPIIHGNKIDVEINDESITDAENVSSDYFYKKDYTLINPVYLKH